MNEIPNFLDRRQLVYSFTMINAYRSACPYQMSQVYIERKIPYVETPERKNGNDLHDAMEHRITGGKPLPDGMQQYEQFAIPFDGRNALAEPKLAVTRFRKPCGYYDDKTHDPEKRVFLRGRADLAVIQGDTAYLGDWKTGSDRFEDRFELAVQAVLLQAKYPELRRIMGQYYWLKTMRVGELYDLSDTDATWSEINRFVGMIEADRVKGSFEKKKSGICNGWCDVTYCENRKEKR